MTVAVLLSLDDAPGLWTFVGEVLLAMVAVLLSLDDAPGQLVFGTIETNRERSQSYFHWMMRPD